MIDKSDARTVFKAIIENMDKEFAVSLMEELIEDIIKSYSTNC